MKLPALLSEAAGSLRSVVGLLGYGVIFFGGIAAWFGLIDASPGGPATFLAIPVAAFEILLLPFWLYFRGFEMPGAASAPE